MSIVDRFTRDKASRFVWGGLMLACVLGLALSWQRERAALDDEIAAAEARAVAYANTVFYDAVESPSVTSTTLTFRVREMLVAVQGGVFTDPTVARTRLYDVDGVLRFATDLPRTSFGVLQVEDPAVVETATEGGSASAIANDTFTMSTIGLEGSPTSLFQVFVPLRVTDRLDPLGAVQIDFLYDSLVERSRDPWLQFHLLFAGLAALFLLLTIMSFRRPVVAVGAAAVAEPGEAGATHDAEPVSAAASASVASSEVEVIRGELQVLREQLAQAEEAYGFLETKWKAAQAALAGSAAQPAPDHEARLHELQEELRQVEAERALLRAGQPESIWEARAKDLEQQLRAATATGTRVADAAQGKEDPNGAKDADVMARLVQADQARTTAEERARDAEGRLAALERQMAEIRKGASGSTPTLVPASEGGRQAGAEEREDVLADLGTAADDRERAADDRTRAGSKESTEGDLGSQSPALSDEANALRARLARTAARKKQGPEQSG